MKAKWQQSDRGETYTLPVVPNLLTIVVERDTSGQDQINPYKVRLFGTLLKNRWSTAEGAKAAGIRAAEKYLGEALENIS